MDKVDLPGKDHLAIEFQLQLVQSPSSKGGVVPLQMELPLLQLALLGPQLQLVVGYLPYSYSSLEREIEIKFALNYIISLPVLSWCCTLLNK